MTNETEPDAAFRPAAEYRISDLDTLRMLADPLRYRLLHTMATRPTDPWTVKEMARALGEPATKLYYHVNMLEERGLLVVTGSRLVSGILEKRYQIVAERLEVDRTVLAAGDAGADETIDSVLGTIFESTRDEIRTAIRTGLATIHDATPGLEPVMLTKGFDRLSRARAAEFRDRLTALQMEFEADTTAGAAEDELHPYGLVLAFYPLPDPAPAAPKRRQPHHPATEPAQ
jgi:hypothetical protein